MFSIELLEEKIKFHFDDLIKKFELEVVKVNSEFEAIIKLIGKKCEINFTYDRGELGCAFIPPSYKSNAKYPVILVWKHLFKSDNKRYASGWNIDEQLKNFSLLISERLINVINGDFSWIHGYETNNFEMSKKIEFIINYLPLEHQIVKKFWQADLTWISDLKRDYDK